MYSRGGISSARDGLRRLRHEQEEVLVAALVEQQSRADRLAGQSIAKNEVAIARESLGVGERHLGAPLPGRAEHHVMRGRRDLLNRHARRDRRPRDGTSLSGASPSWVYGALTNASSGDAWLSLLLGIPRTDHGRVHELVHAVRRHEQLRVLELDGDGVAGQHVGDVHREDVGAALLQQRRALALALRGLELRASLSRAP